jgi:hypothetical protein
MKNIFGPWLSNLRKPVGPAPKAIPDHQFYMKHPHHREKVAVEFEAQYPDRSGCDKNEIKERNRIAAELFRKESKEVQEALRMEAAEELRVAKERHEQARSGLPSDLPVDIDAYACSFLF